MLNLNPQTDAGKVFAELAEEFFAAMKWEGFLKAARPFAKDQARRLVEAADANPDAARASLKPLVVRLVRAFDLTPADLFVECEVEACAEHVK